MIEKEYIEELVNKSLEGTSLFLTSVSVKSGNKIMVFIDGDQGVGIDECTNLSRFIESSLNRDVEDFELNVSSHGLTSPLVMPRQFVKNTGRKVTVLMPDGKKHSGTILSAFDDHFIIQPDLKKKEKSNTAQTESVRFEYSEVKEVKINISF